MKELAINNLAGVIFGAFCIGSVIAILNMYQATKDVESVFENSSEEYDSDIFV
jgi:hypothetical protein